MDDALLSEIACLSIAVKDRVGEIGDDFGEGIGNEDGVVGDRDGPGPAADLNFVREDDWAERAASVDDRHSAFGVVGDIEQGTVRRQSAAPRLGARFKLRDDPALI